MRALGVGIGITDFLQFASVFLLYMDFNGLAGPGGQDAVLRLAVLDCHCHRPCRYGHAFALHRFGRRQFKQDFLRLNDQFDRRLAGYFLQFIILIDIHNPFVSALFRGRGAGNFRAVLLGIGIVHHIPVRHGVAVLHGDIELRPVIRHVRLQDGCGSARTDAQLGRFGFVDGGGHRFAAAADIFAGSVFGFLVVGRFALGVQCGGCDVFHAAQLVRLNRDVTHDRKLSGRAPGAVRHSGAGFRVQDCNSDASGNPHALSAGT